MQCIQCQHEAPAGAVFCPQCGSQLSNTQDVPSEMPSNAPPDEAQAMVVEVAATPLALTPHETQMEPAADQPVDSPAAIEAPIPNTPTSDHIGNIAPTREIEAPASKKKRKGHGCLISFCVFLLLIALALAVLFDLPTRLGLISSPAERMFVDAPDPIARATLTKEFEQANQPTQGISFYVLPYKDRDYSLAYVVLDQSKGYRYVDTGFENPIFATFELVARSKAVEEAQIYRVSVEFREPDGSTLCVLTAPVFAIQQYAAKTIDKKQFYMQMDGHENLEKVFKDQYLLMGSTQ